MLKNEFLFVTLCTSFFKKKEHLKGLKANSLELKTHIVFKRTS